MLDDLLDLKWREIEGTELIYRIYDAYLKETGKAPCRKSSCTSVLKNFFKAKRRLRIQESLIEKKMPESTYKLKPGAKVFIHSMSMYVTSANLTDELAAKALEENPRQAGRFEVIPEIQVTTLSEIASKRGKRKNK